MRARIAPRRGRKSFRGDGGAGAQARSGPHDRQLSRGGPPAGIGGPRMSRFMSGKGHITHSTTVVEGRYQPMTAPVLVLNASYEPINVCAARRAIVLVLKGVAMTEEENGHFLHSTRLAMRVPSVIRLLEYRRIPHQTRALSRKNILLRDRNTCQYCGQVLA